MRFLLDTNAWIVHLRGTAPQLSARVLQCPPGDIVLCSIVIAELRFGALRSAKAAKNLALLDRLRRQFVSLPFDDLAAEDYSEIRNTLTRQGLLIGANDLLIAALGRSRQLTVVTHNVSEFSRVPGLVIEDWE